jgi:hypothetical protein
LAHYLFLAVGALEGAISIKNNALTNLSAQQVIDCVYPGAGCLGSFFFIFQSRNRFIYFKLFDQVVGQTPCTIMW